MMMLRELVSAIEPLKVYGDMDKEITGISCDSRKTEKGNLFVAIKGYSKDGHLYIHDATSRGASAIVIEEFHQSILNQVQDHSRKSTVFIVVPNSRRALALLSDRFYNHPSKNLRLIGITGTNGKTTTSYLIRSALHQWGRNVGLLGTVGYVIDDEIIEAPNTTPESLDLQRYLSRMVNSGITHAVVEVSSHALSLNRVDGCEFDVAVFTNITRDHIDFHCSIEEYIRAKRMLLGYIKREGFAVINIDDRCINEFSSTIRGNVLTYGLNEKADVMARLLPSMKENETTLAINTPSEGFETSTTLLGRHNIYNILAATSACVALGVPLHAINNGIKSQGCIPGRLEKIDLGQDFLCIVDYAHTEDALERLICTARELITQDSKLQTPNSSPRIITIFGCGGNRDRGKRPLMGKVASELSDIVIITSDNPRDEEPLEIINEIISGIKGDNYYVIPDRKEAINYAINCARKGDTVLIAGKGHEDYQIIGGKRYPFDDRKVAREMIKSKCKNQNAKIKIQNDI
ncbi:MAG: UDP-N-acetylmuramoyl-L-alanyl-D-glutamate--2,6-diaminopimelate ligase [Nitrospirota bacterium]